VGELAQVSGSSALAALLALDVTRAALVSRVQFQEEEQSMRRRRALEDIVHDLKLIPEGRYDYCAILISSSLTPLEEAIETFIDGKWRELDALTGPQFLLFVVLGVDKTTGLVLPSRTVGRPPRGAPVYAGERNDVYQLARELGINLSLIPCMILFSSPAIETSFLTLPLRDLVGSSATQDDLGQFFLDLQAILNSCSLPTPEERMSELEEAVERSWPSRVKPEMPREGEQSWVRTIADGTTILANLMRAVEVFRP
jgi:hypothetical protein